MYILLFTAIAAGFCGFIYLVERFLAPAVASKIKADPYECGVPVIGQPWVKVHFRYYIFALLFLIFDVETVFLFPWAVAFSELGLLGLIEMFAFIVILFLGLLYPWKKGVLRWL